MNKKIKLAAALAIVALTATACSSNFRFLSREQGPVERLADEQLGTACSTFTYALRLQNFLTIAEKHLVDENGVERAPKSMEVFRRHVDLGQKIVENVNSGVTNEADGVAQIAIVRDGVRQQFVYMLVELGIKRGEEIADINPIEALQEIRDLVGKIPAAQADLAESRLTLLTECLKVPSDATPEGEEPLDKEPTAPAIPS